MSDELRLQAHLEKHPDDLQARRILADLLEEQGREGEMRCQRWLAEQGKWPDNNLGDYKETGWCWWSFVSRPDGSRRHAALPIKIHDHMPSCRWLYPTRIEAEKVLAEALAKAERSK